MSYINDQVLFIHIPKTGGQTVSKVLWNQEVRIANPHTHQPLTYFENNFNLQSLYVFTIVRNPYERAASFYRFLKQRKEANRVQGTFKEWLFNMHGEPEFLFNSQSWFTKSNKETKIKIFKYESGLPLIIDQVYQEAGIKPLFKTMKLNSTKPMDLGFDEECKQRIQELYKEDFKQFGYEQ